MLNISSTLAHMNITPLRLSAVQEIRDILDKETETQQPKVAAQLVFDLLGVKVEFEDANQALFTTQYIVDSAIAGNCEVEDGEIALANALRRADAFMRKPENQWMFARKEDTVDTSNNQTVVEGLDTKVAVKADGSIKKGGKQVLAAALYEKHVLKADVKPTNAWFKELLCKELGMSGAGASTYAYNCDAGHNMLVKASKGGAKAKA